MVGIDEVFHHVPQLPDIAGPCVTAEKVLHRLRQAEVAVQLPAELIHQQEHIVPPLRQGRDDRRQGVQPVIEVPAEGALPHLPFQRLVGGGHDADVHMDDAVAADPHDLPLLQGPQQLDLKSGAHALHLVQKQCAPVGQLKEAGAAALFGSGEGPLLVAEQLAFQQILRKSRHVDGQKRPGRPAGGPVNGVGEQLLAGAGLADQKNGTFTVGHPGQGLLGPADGRRLSDHIVKAVFGVIALVEQLAPQLVLPDLHVIEPLEQGEGADTGVLPDDRNHLHAEVDAVDLDDLGGQRLPGAETRGEGDIGKDLLAPFSLDQRRADAGHILCLTAAGEDLALFVDADDAVLQTLQ